MKTRHTIIATLVGGLLVSGVAFAKDKWQFHEADWSGTRSYGNVALSDDSVGNWGPWAIFEEPAAGAPPTQAAMPGAGAGDPYQLIPAVLTPTVAATSDVCQAGAWCGYAAFANFVWNDNEGTSSESRPYAGRFALTLNPDDPAAVAPGVGSGAGNVLWRLQTLGSIAPVVGDSGGDMAASFGAYQPGVGSFTASRETNPAGALDGGNAYGNTNAYVETYLPTSNPEVSTGWFVRYIENYIRGGDGANTYYDGKVTWGFFVAGITTPQAYLDAQHAGNVVATYAGNSGDWRASMVPVNMTVNFGNATWTGSWNNGGDGSVMLRADSAGNKYWVGQVGFNASGTINGANIASTQITANDGTIGAGSSVKGAFFGQTAGSIGGVSDIVKTKTVGESAVTASHTTVFLVDKVVVK